MKHLVLPQIPEEGGEIELDRSSTHYLVNVRRLRDGDSVVVTDGAGRRAQALLGKGDSDRWFLRGVGGFVETHLVGDNTLGPLVFFVAVLKGRSTDHVIRSVTEIGVDTIVPVATIRSVVRINELSRTRVERWTRIVREACQQSGRLDQPIIKQPIPFRDALRRPANGTRHVIFHESGSTAVDLSAGKAIGAFAIGPEGGFASEEIVAAHDSGWEVAHISTPVLRAETAAIAAATLVQHQRTQYNRATTEGIES